MRVAPASIFVITSGSGSLVDTGTKTCASDHKWLTWCALLLPMPRTGRRAPRPRLLRFNKHTQDISVTQPPWGPGGGVHVDCHHSEPPRYLGALWQRARIGAGSWAQHWEQGKKPRWAGKNKTSDGARQRMEQGTREQQRRRSGLEAIPAP